MTSARDIDAPAGADRPGRHPRRRRGAAALTLAALLGTASLTPPAGVAGWSRAAPTICDPATIGARVPVLLVHGFDSNGSTWDAQRAALGADTAHTCVDVFDYGPVNTQWVSDDKIGAALAARIHELAGESTAGGGPGKVVVVAHSMGGLATRCAADVACAGPGARGVADQLADVITYGTPNTGSWLRGAGRDAVANVLGPGLTGPRCTLLLFPVTGPCATFAALLTSPAGYAFTPGSEQLQRLRNLPGSVPVYAIAGSVAVTTTVFQAQLTIPRTDVGDLVVSRASALAAAHQVGPLGGSTVIDCGTVSLATLTPGVPAPAGRLRCVHPGEPEDARFTAAAVAQIRAAVVPLETSAASGGAGVVPVGPDGMPAGWRALPGTAVSAPGPGQAQVRFDGTFWGGIYATGLPGCTFTLSVQGRRVDDGGLSGYGVAVLADTPSSDSFIGRGLQYDGGTGGYRDTAYPDDTGDTVPASLDHAWHTLTLRGDGAGYTMLVDGTVVSRGLLPPTCQAVAVRVWNGGTAQLRQLQLLD